jgi:DNA-binding NtrC family response regulator
MHLLKSYPWPGNIRELENVLERAVNIMERPEITPVELPDHLQLAAGGRSLPEGPSLKAREYETILRMLEETGGNLRAAAGRLGIARGTLYNKIVKYRIDLEKFRRNG